MAQGQNFTTIGELIREAGIESASNSFILHVVPNIPGGGKKIPVSKEAVKMVKLDELKRQAGARLDVPLHGLAVSGDCVTKIREISNKISKGTDGNKDYISELLYQLPAKSLQNCDGIVASTNDVTRRLRLFVDALFADELASLDSITAQMMAVREDLEVSFMCPSPSYPKS